MSRVQRRDPEKIYHRIDRIGLERLTPIIDWAKYFASLGYPRIKAIDVKTPDFVSELNAILKKTPLAQIKA